MSSILIEQDGLHMLKTKFCLNCITQTLNKLSVMKQVLGKVNNSGIHRNHILPFKALTDILKCSLLRTLNSGNFTKQLCR